MSKNILNEKNYNKTICNSDISAYVITCQQIFDKFINHAENGITVTNKVYYTYIVTKGLGALIHVFNMLTLYTKNIELIEHHCEKAIAYYIEFISQIGSDGQNYLQLNSKDAILFVYKKTIFDINNEVRKNLELSKEQTNILNLIFNINKLNYLIREYIINDTEANSMNMFIYEKTAIILNRILKVPTNKIESFTSNLLSIVTQLQNVNINVESYWQIINKASKRLSNKHISVDVINKRINSEKFKEQSFVLTAQKLASWVFRQ